MDQIREKFLKWEQCSNEQNYNDLIKNIWEIYHPKLQVYISQIHKSGNTTDLVSDILLHVFETLDRYKSHYSFSTWIYTVARNYSIDLLREKHIQTENIEDYFLGNKETPETILIRNSEQEMIREAVTLLSPTDKELIYLYYYEELKYREISEITGIPEGTIKYRMSENKKRLKKDLERSLVR